MASLRECAKEIYDVACEGVLWFCLWKTGKSWHTELMLGCYADYDTFSITLDREEDYEDFKRILDEDSNALFLNGYYYSLGVSAECPEDSSLSNLIGWLKCHYDIGKTRLKDWDIEYAQ